MDMNTERRRNKRKLNLIMFIALAVIAVGGIAALVIILAGKACAAPADPGAAAQPTERGADIPEGTVLPVETMTEAPLASAAPDGDEDPDEPPVRVSDEQSEALASVKLNRGRGAEGSFAVSFVNNTDRTLYSVGFETKGLDITFASVGAMPARFTVEDGVLTIPLFNELRVNDTVELYFEFASDTVSGFALPSFSYDTSFLLTASIESPFALTFEGCVFNEERGEDGFIYTVEEAGVHKVSVGR